jgi:hypothetical protein
MSEAAAALTEKTRTAIIALRDELGQLVGSIRAVQAKVSETESAHGDLYNLRLAFSSIYGAAERLVQDVGGDLQEADGVQQDQQEPAELHTYHQGGRKFRDHRMAQAGDDTV